jgi:acetyltransferase-like isoleucine patch superfamily enzyme
MAMRMAAIFVAPHKERVPLSYLNETGFIEHTAIIRHPDFVLGRHCFLGDRVIISERRNGGSVRFGDHVQIYNDTTIETGVEGSVDIDEFASIHPNCHIFSYVEPIKIGKGVMIAPACALFSYNHRIAPSQPIRNQPLESDGPIIIGDEAWVGTHVTILHNVTIGNGAVVGAGSLVVKDVPENAIAVGVPAKVVGFR